MGILILTSYGAVIWVNLRAKVWAENSNYAEKRDEYYAIKMWSHTGSPQLLTFWTKQQTKWFNLIARDRKYVCEAYSIFSNFYASKVKSW